MMNPHSRPLERLRATRKGEPHRDIRGRRKIGHEGRGGGRIGEGCCAIRRLSVHGIRGRTRGRWCIDYRTTGEGSHLRITRRQCQGVVEAVQPAGTRGQ